MTEITRDSDKIYFQPTFGNRPERIIGRNGELGAFINGLREPVGARERCTFLLGQRGMGKTAMLLEIADRAAAEGFVVARVTAHENMPSNIIEQLQLNGERFFGDEKKRITGVNAGVLGFSFGLSFSEPAQRQYGFRAKLSLLCDRLAEKDKGVLILIDEVYSSQTMREVAASYQELVGDRKNIAMCMAGLPYAVSGILNDRVLTFLNRANKVRLGPISVASIRAYYDQTFSAMRLDTEEELIDRAAAMTGGLPYLMQLIGYYLTMYTWEKKQITEQVLEKAHQAALQDMDDNVFVPILAPLSDNDRIFLTAMAQCAEPVTTSELQKKLGEKGPAIQPYRKRLIEAGVIEAPRRGELVFAVPFLADYLRNNAFRNES